MSDHRLRALERSTDPADAPRLLRGHSLGCEHDRSGKPIQDRKD